MIQLRHVQIANNKMAPINLVAKLINTDITGTNSIGLMHAS